MTFSEIVSVSLLFAGGLLISAKLTWLSAEFTRDFWHYLCHRVPLLFRHIHASHHVAYGRNYQVRSLELFRKDRLTHYITECCWMLVISSIVGLLGFCHFHYGFKWGCLYGIIHSLDELGRAIASAISPELGIRMETLHLEVTKAPTVGRVSPGYHLGHHDRDLMSAFCGVSPLFDKLMGTARSYRKLTFGFMSTANGLCNELRHCLESEGSTTFVLPPYWSDLSPKEQHHWLNQIDVLVLVDF